MISNPSGIIIYEKQRSVRLGVFLVLLGLLVLWFECFHFGLSYRHESISDSKAIDLFDQISHQSFMLLPLYFVSISIITLIYYVASGLELIRIVENGTNLSLQKNGLWRKNYVVGIEDVKQVEVVGIHPPRLYRLNILYRNECRLSFRVCPAEISSSHECGTSYAVLIDRLKSLFGSRFKIVQ